MPEEEIIAPQNVETAELPNPVIKEEKINIRDLAEKADRETTEPESQQEETPEAPETVKPDEKAPDETVEQKAERERDEKGRFKPKEGEEAKPEADKKPESEYAKKKSQIEKDAERLARNRREFEEQKARERADFQRQREEFDRQRTAPRSDTYTSKDYEKVISDAAALARKQYSEGNFEEAMGNVDLMEKAFKALPEIRKREQETAAQHQQQELGRIQNEDIAKVEERFPDLKVTDSPMQKKVSEILSKAKYLQFLPIGASEAAFVADKWIKADERDAAVAENEALRKENAELKRKIMPLAPRPNERTGPVSFDNMKPEAQLATIKRLAAESDSMAYRP